MTALALYRAGTRLAAPYLRGLLRRRLAAGKEDPERLAERQGEPSRPRPDGPLIWLHAASVGESLSALSLIRRLLDLHPDVHILVTTGTVTSARLLATRLPPRSFHQFFPLDVPGWGRGFLDHWRPDLVLWMESELWPNMLGELRHRNVPIALVNARMSAGSFANWRRLPGAAATLLRSFAICFAQSEAQAERLRRLGAREVLYLGNLKYSADPLPADADALAALRASLDGRDVLLWASTHEGEEDIAGALHKRLRTDHPTLLTVIVPRHPARAAAVAGDLSQAGLRVALRSRGDAVTADTDIYLADTMGELGLFYRIAEIAVVGNSFGHDGGHNPLEPAQLDCAVLFGPGMANFQAVVDEMIAAGAAIACADEAALETALRRLLADDAARTALARAAKTVADAQRDVVDHILERLAPLRARLASRSAS
jgi:3-deoxy-D-manno-octulosonic-acid transferase